jgi:arabinogalactan oligomer / maltooligosaccharide transport system substrate-binding protein
MKKNFYCIPLALILILAMALPGCASSASSNAGGSSSKTKTSIVVWTNFDTEADTLQKYGDSWAKETGNTVKVIHQTPDLQKFAQAVKSKDGPDAVFGIANDQLANYVSAGLAEEVPNDVYTDGDYVDASVKACYFNGKKYAVPIAVETNALFYNTDKIKSAPATWDDLVEEAKTNGGIQFEATSVYYDLGFLEAFGSYIFKYSDGSYNVDDIGLGSDGAVSAYTYLQKLAVDDKFFSADTTSDLAKSSFQNGKTAFYIGGPWDISGFKSAGTKFSVATMPTLNGSKFITPVGVQVGFVSSASKKQDAVWSFFEYLMKKAPGELFTVGGRIPASVSEQQKIDADDATKAFMTQISYSEPLPTLSELGQVWTPFSDNMKLLFKGTITPEKAAANIQKQVKDGISLMNSGK